MHQEGPPGEVDLVQLDRDHPGFRDPVYRARRNHIARIALEHRSGQPVPDAPYTEAEHAVWSTVWQTLGPLHRAHVVSDLVDLQDRLGLQRDRIPQLSALNPRLFAASGFRMEPVAGLVAARTFLVRLGQGVFLSTQYVRHHSRPFYTPEPDVLHELIGHAASLMHPGVAAVNQAMGRAAGVATEAEVARLSRVYWYTVEFGLALEAGQLRAVGAGLLSSCGELARIHDGPELRDFDPDAMGATPYDPTDYQPWLYVAPSLDAMLNGVTRWVEEGRWRDGVAPPVTEGAGPLC
ncbi:MAG: phenylalanine 4-monooxygenase [Alphaproteobacteria bacterium]|nr:phenylalanine 4-monooxygenase [Alphaproteobacteria bacterium]